MMKKVTSLFFSFLMLFSFPASADFYEEELDIEEVIEPQTEEDDYEVVTPDGSTIITITCTGDMTIGGDNYHHKTRFYDIMNEKHGGDINFTMENVREILRKDDLTLVNFEGTFTDSKYVPDSKKSNDFLFNISPSYVNVLTDNFIEAVSLENNHVLDHGEEAYEETKETIRNAGVVYSTSEEIGLYSVKGIQIAMLSYLCIDRYGKPTGGYDTFEEKVCADIAQAKQVYPLVIVSFHWGLEPTKSNPSRGYIPTANQLRLGRMAVDAGADLIIGNHSHRVQPIECYQGVYICYSLGNFCFAGNDKPADMNSMIFQTRFRISKTGDISNDGFRIIPIRITSAKDTNNYTPTPIDDDMKIVGIINTLKENGKDYGVSEYPLEWE